MLLSKIRQNSYECLTDSYGNFVFQEIIQYTNKAQNLQILTEVIFFGNIV